MTMYLAFLSHAIAAPCVPLIDRPTGSRLHLWDSVEGEISELDISRSHARNEVISDTTGYRESEIPIDLMVRLADIFADEGRFWVRCDPASLQAESWFEHVLDITEPLLRAGRPTDHNYTLMRAHTDALCGLGRWDECLQSLRSMRSAYDEPVRDCEYQAWLGDSLWAIGDWAGALNSYRDAVLGIAEPECAYVQYRTAWAQHRLSETGDAIQTMTSLVLMEIPDNGNASVSTTLAAALLDLPLLRAYPNDLRASDEMARLEPIVTTVLTGPLRQCPRGRDLPERLRNAATALLSVGLLVPAWEVIVALDSHPRARKQPFLGEKRQGRTGAAVSLETLVVRFVEHSRQMRERDPTSSALVGGLVCRAACLYTVRYPQSDRAIEMRDLLQSEPGCACSPQEVDGVH